MSFSPTLHQPLCCNSVTPLPKCIFSYSSHQLTFKFEFYWRFVHSLFSRYKHTSAVWNLDLDLKPLDQPNNNIPLHCARRCGALVSPFAICSCLFEDKNPADRESEANQAFVFRAGSQVEGIGGEVSARRRVIKAGEAAASESRGPEHSRRKSARLSWAAGFCFCV